MIRSILEEVVAFLLFIFCLMVGVVVYVGVPIVGLLIVYYIAKFLFTGIW